MKNTFFILVLVSLIALACNSDKKESTTTPIADSVEVFTLKKEIVSKTLSLAAAFSRLAMTIIQGVNLLNHCFVLLLLSGAGYLTVFAPDQLHALVLLFLNAHKYGVYIWEVFFGLHLIVLGYLVFKSGYFPRILGILLILGSLGYLMESFSNFLLPNNQAISTIYSVFLGISAIGELSFAFWLLFKGVSAEQWGKRALESA